MTALDQLSKIKKVPAPEGMYDAILAKVALPHVISWKRAGVAAALLIGLAITEFYLLDMTKSETELSQLEELLPSSINRLYYE